MAMTKSEIVTRCFELSGDERLKRIAKDELQKSMSFLTANLNREDEGIILVAMGKVFASLTAMGYGMGKSDLLSGYRFKNLEKVFKRYDRAKKFELEKPEPTLF